MSAGPAGRFVVCGAPRAAERPWSGVARVVDVEGVVDVAGVPFAPWWDGRSGAPVAGWFVEVPPGRYDVAHVLATSSGDARAEVHLHYEDGDDPEWLYVSSSYGREPPRYGEPLALVLPPRTRVWAARVPVTRRSELRAIRLPEAGPVEVLGVTLVQAEDLEGPAAGRVAAAGGAGSSRG